MRDVRELLQQAAQADAPLDLAAVRTRAQQLRVRRRAAAAAAAVLVVAGVVGVAAWVQPTGRAVVLPPAASTAPSPSGTAVLIGPMQTVQVFFSPDGEDVCSEVVPFPRQIPTSAAGAAAALRELLRGPTAEEQEQGATSLFAPATADLLQSVRVTDGVAYVSLHHLDLGNVSTSCGSSILLGQLNATLQQLPTVDRAYYALDGDPLRFYASLEGECPPELTLADGTCDASGFEQATTSAPMPTQAAAVHGGMPFAVYLAVSEDSLDPALERARQQAAAAGYEAGGGELGCDEGAREALGLDADRSWSHVALYFDDRGTADRFVRGYPHEVVGVAQVTTFCLD